MLSPINESSCDIPADTIRLTTLAAAGKEGRYCIKPPKVAFGSTLGAFEWKPNLTGNMTEYLSLVSYIMTGSPATNNSKELPHQDLLLHANPIAQKSLQFSYHLAGDLVLLG
jgi:hypothetical protein